MSWQTSFAAALLSALTLWHGLGVYLPSLNTRHTSLDGVPHAPSRLQPTPGLARRLVVIMIDGLSFDAARALDELAPLRSAGAFRSLEVEFPSYTSPAITSFVTGLDPADSGTRLNGQTDHVAGLDSLLRAAGDAGIPTALHTGGWSTFADLLMAPPSARIEQDKLALGPCRESASSRR